MDDGNKSRNNFYLNTDSYTLSEVELLIKVLKSNFDLNCTYHKRKIVIESILSQIQWINLDL